MAKIARKTQKIFAKDGSAIGQFGSAQAATPTLSSDLDTLQALPAYDNGWNDAVISGQKRPPLEEFNGLKYINDYQNAYLLQEGIAEYDAATTYYIGSLVKDSGTGIIYKSITDDNIGHALTDTTNWELQGDLALLNNVASNTIIVNSLADFPAPIAGVITLESGKEYMMNAVVVTPFRFVIPAGAFIRISANSLSHALVYVGGGTMFTGLDFGLLITSLVLFQAPGGTFFDLDGASQFFPVSTIFIDCVSIGSINIEFFGMLFCQFNIFSNGMVLADRTDLNPRIFATIAHTAFTGSTNTVTDFIRVEGFLLDITIADSSFTTAGSNENILNLDQSLAANNAQIVVQSIFNIGNGGNVFAADSLKQDYLGAKFYGSTNVSDSTVSVQMGFKNNAEVTTINTLGVKELVNARWLCQLPERAQFQDFLTFDNTTNTITARLIDGTTAFNHGLVNDDRVMLKAGLNPVGTLPPELDETTNYYIVAATAQTFQVSLTQGGAAVSFTTDGTGTNYYRHLAGTNAASWLIYIGLETEKIAVNGSLTLSPSSGQDRLVFAEIVKLDTGFNEVDIGIDNVFGEGATVTSNSSDPQGSGIHSLVELSQDESIRIYVTNEDTADNITVTNSNITFLKA